MALNSTSGQQQDLPGEETDQGVVAVKSIQNVHLADHESKKEENTLNIESKQVGTVLAIRPVLINSSRQLHFNAF